MVVSGIAVLGKEVRRGTRTPLVSPLHPLQSPRPSLRARPAQNNPLYIRSFGVHDALRFHFIVHTALDFVEEKGARPRP